MSSNIFIFLAILFLKLENDGNHIYIKILLEKPKTRWLSGLSTMYPEGPGFKLLCGHNLALICTYFISFSVTKLCKSI
jgi:hypothetical protein